jgi:hypothetical protein
MRINDGDICGKAYDYRKISKKAELIIIVSLLTIFIFVLFFMTPKEPALVIHKTLNHGQFDIVVFSEGHFTRIIYDRELYADVWMKGKKVNSHHLSKLSLIEDYDLRIKEITILPLDSAIKVEFIYPENSKSRTGTDLYSID